MAMMVDGNGDGDDDGDGVTLVTDGTFTIRARSAGRGRNKIVEDFCAPRSRWFLHIALEEAQQSGMRTPGCRNVL